MSFKGYSKCLISICKGVLIILPVFFILLLIFGFNKSDVAWITILAALIHEIGHFLCICYIRRSTPEIRGVLSGFRIRPGGYMSYDSLIKVYLAGPAINLFVFVISTFFIPVFGEGAVSLSLVNLATAMSNLLPIRGYDGYGIIKSIIEKRSLTDGAIHKLNSVSSTLTLIFCIISLYFIDRLGEGYWIFAVFFISMLKCIKTDLGE